MNSQRHDHQPQPLKALHMTLSHDVHERISQASAFLNMSAEDFVSNSLQDALERWEAERCRYE